MNMLGEQIKELREKADMLDGLEGMDNLVRILREAADTIESLQGEANHWKVEQIHAYSNWEDAYSRVKEFEADNGSRWHELFGTPERAARTLYHNGTLTCRECLIREQCAETPEDGNCMIVHYDELLEWLKGGAK